MNTKFPRTVVKRPLAHLLLATLALLGPVTCATAQTDWGNALSFRGTNDHVVVPAGIWFSNSFTIEARVYVRSHQYWARVLDFGNGAPLDNVILTLSEGSTGRPSFRYFVQTTGESITAPSPLPLNQWVHLAVTLSNQTASLFVNGVVVASTNNLPSPRPVSRTNAFLARSPFPGNASPDMMLDEVRIWNVARSAPEIQDSMAHPLSGTEPNLLAYWRLDEAMGPTAHDATPHQLDGALQGTPQWTSWIPPLWGNALSFAGTNDYVSATIPALASNYTVSAWVYLRGRGNSDTTYMAVLSSTNCNGSAEVTIHSATHDFNGPQQLALERCGGFTGTPSAAAVPTNEWAHVAVAVSSTKQVSYFIDGIPAGSWDASSKNLTIGPGIALGYNTAASIGRRFDGLLDDVQIWSTRPHRKRDPARGCAMDSTGTSATWWPTTGLTSRPVA